MYKTNLEMDFRSIKTEKENDQKGMLLSMTVHVVLLLAMYFMPSPPPPIEKVPAQIVVELPKDLLGGGPALGLPNQGSGDNPAPGKPDPNAGNSEPAPAPKPTPVPPTPTPPPPVKPVISKPTPPAPTPSKPIQTTEDPNAVAIRRQEAETRRKNEEAKFQQQAAEREKQRQADAARQAQADAQRAADEKARAAQAAKDKFGGRFGNGSGGGTNGGGGTGTGQGRTGTPGNQGKPDGDPNSKVLDGMGRGPGTVNGFGGRGVKSAPKLSENSQKSGRIVLDVCVDGDGNVTSAKYKALGSNSNDSELIDAAVRNARQYQFSEGGADRQCGTITYNFIVK
jgi:outer membrane biosynthesis protein TonB